MIKRIIFCVIACAWLPVAAQPVVEETSPAPEASPAPVASPRAVTSNPSVISQAAETPSILSEIPLLQWGPISLRPHLLYRFIYGDGIQSSPGQGEKTVIHELSPGILFGLGTRWTLDYTPTFSYYSSSRFRDTVGHSVVLNGNTTYENWAFGFSQSYRSSSQPLVETGSQTDEESYITDFFGSYHFSDEIWLDFGLNQTFRFADGTTATNIVGTNNFPSSFNDSREWSTMEWLNYQISTGLNAAIGAGFGYVDLETGDDMTYEQVQGRVRWRATEKISINVNGGAEYRQFVGSTNDSIVNPIYGVTVDYRPFEHTKIAVSGNRRVAVSYFEGHITEATDVQISLDQRLLEKLNLNLTYGYHTTDFVSSTRSVSTNSISLDRRDEGSFFNARLSCPIKERITLAAFYNWSENDSDQSGFQYSSTQVGLEARYKY